MFIDKVRVNFQAGNGGRGGVYFEPNGKPAGGVGGKGGSIYLEGTNNVADLSSFKQQEKYIAESGQEGGRNKSRGASAEDLVIKVPIETSVYDIEHKLVVRISKVGERKLVVKGGIGGLGNHYFRRGQLATLNKYTPGESGEALKGFMELKLVADIAFVGFPNAGKSSMLNALSNASVKVASYPFTTLEPHLAVAEGLVLLDLPGLIEGTTKGKGLGTRFMKHVDNARLVAHFISLETKDLVKQYKLIREELKEISEKLAEKEEIIILTKKDLFSEEEIEKKVKELAKLNRKTKTVSIYNYDSLQELLKVFKYSIG